MGTRILRSGVYQIVNEINGKFYVGSSKDINNRWSNWKRSFSKPMNHKSLLWSAVQKYGIENFTFILLEECEPTKEMLEERENYYIKTLKPEYNILLQAYTNVGFKHSNETKQTMSKRAKEYMSDPKIRQKYSNLRKGKTFEEIFGEEAKEILERQSVGRTGKAIGKNPWNKNKIGLQEAWNKGTIGLIRNRIRKEKRPKISKSRGPVYPQHQQKMTEAARIINTGKERSEETRQKISESNLNSIARKEFAKTLVGIPRSDDVKLKVSQAIKTSEIFQQSVKERIGKKRKDNTSGEYGIVWDNSKSKWMVRVNKKFYGRYETIEEAILKRNAAIIVD